jgi:hypothetical protein
MHERKPMSFLIQILQMVAQSFWGCVAKLRLTGHKLLLDESEMEWWV